MAYYNLESDFVQKPPFEAFRDAESYYASLAHECTHWTRYKSQLDRNLGRKRSGDAGYAMEELVAELGSAFLCADLDSPTLNGRWPRPSFTESREAEVGAASETLISEKENNYDYANRHHSNWALCWAIQAHSTDEYAVFGLRGTGVGPTRLVLPQMMPF
jgi:hypothetical protein